MLARIKEDVLKSNANIVEVYSKSFDKLDDKKRMEKDSDEFINDYIHCPIVDLAAKIRDEIEESGEIPEDFDFTGKESGWKDKW